MCCCLNPCLLHGRRIAGHNTHTDADNYARVEAFSRQYSSIAPTQEGVGAASYRHVVFMNSSVRGPFLPAMWPKGRHWSTAFTDRLSDTVKLVGPTISCEGPRPHSPPFLRLTSFRRPSDFQVEFSDSGRPPGLWLCVQPSRCIVLVGIRGTHALLLAFCDCC